jgi:hypothetical protein
MQFVCGFKAPHPLHHELYQGLSNIETKSVARNRYVIEKAELIGRTPHSTGNNLYKSF